MIGKLMKFLAVMIRVGQPYLRLRRTVRESDVGDNRTREMQEGGGSRVQVDNFVNARR